MRALVPVLLLLSSGCSSGSGGGGHGAGGIGGTGGGGGLAGSGGGGTGGQAGATPSPFAAELCNEWFCWEEPKPFAGQINSLSATTNTVWAAGEGMLAKRSGGAWTAAPTPDSVGLAGVFAFDDANVWAVGAQGAIVHFDGTAITRVDSPTTSKLYGIWGAAPDDIWAVGEDGAIVHYDGATWSSVSGGYDELHAVWGSGPNDVYAVGGTLNVGTVAHFDGTSWTAGSTSLAGAGFYAVSGTDAGNVFAGGSYGYLYRLTPDGNEEYLAQAGSLLYGLVAISPSEVLAVSSDALLRYSGGSFQNLAPLGGSALVRDPLEDRFLIAGLGVSSYTPELVTTEIAPPTFSQVWLGDGDRGIAVTRESEVLAKDGGNWSIVPGIAPATSSGYFNFSGLSDGTRVIINAEHDPPEVYVYDGKTVAALPEPPNAEYMSAVIAGVSKSDLWIFLWSEAAHFDGSSWQSIYNWPSVLGTFSPLAALVVETNDIWVVGVGSGIPEGGIIAHFDGAKWIRQLVGPPLTDFTSIAKVGGKLYVAGSFADKTKQNYNGGFSSYAIEPVLYEKAASGWTKLTIPGVSPDFYGATSALLTTSETELYFVFPVPHQNVANLLVYDGTSFTPRPYPATGCAAAFFTDGTLRLVAGNDPYGILRSR